MLNFTSAPKILKENIVNNFSGSSSSSSSRESDSGNGFHRTSQTSDPPKPHK